MEKKYGKLVRDNIPEIIEEEGKTCHIHIADEKEYGAALGNKLLEESSELASAKSREDRIKESADVLEVLESIWKHEGISEEEVRTIKEKKKESNGGFEKRIILEDVSD